VQKLFRKELAAENDYLRAEILIGEGHLHHVVKKIESHHNAQRPHQGLDNGIPMGFDYPPAAAEPDDVCRESSLGGLLNHYHAAKAA
jgi:hypothetical protein